MTKSIVHNLLQNSILYIYYVTQPSSSAFIFPTKDTGNDPVAPKLNHISAGLLASLFDRRFNNSEVYPLIQFALAQL